MQILTLNKLPTPVLLVWGLPEDACDIKIKNDKHSDTCRLHYLANFVGLESMSKYAKWLDGNWKLIGKLSELTEDRAKELVDSDNEYGVRMFRNYRTTSMPYFDEQIDSLGSFHSAIEAELTGKLMAEDEFLTVDEASSRSKTLPANTLIFKRV